MREYARQRGLRRLMLPVPALSPRLSSLWLGLVTPVYARVGRQLVEGLRNETVVRDDAAARRFRVRPRGAREAIARALVNEDREFAATRWSDALSSGPGPRAFGGASVGSRLVDSRAARVPVPPEAAFAPIRRIGGRQGWYYGNALWRLRGLLDLPLGGAGARRGRRDPERLLPGDTVDFWRVEEVEPDRRLRLSAEMTPARARVAAVRGRARRRRLDHPPDGDLRPGRRAGAPVLVRRLAAPWPRLPRDGPRDRPRGGGRVTGAPEAGLAERLVGWMAANREGLDALMAEEGSRAVHEEFLLAEGGTLPDGPARLERARGASARAWTRHLARAVEAVWGGAEPGLSGRVERWSAAHPERLEALVLEERAAAARRGASADPAADERDAELIAHCRLLAEGLATQARPLDDQPPPDFGRRVAAWARAQERRRREVERAAVAAWRPGPGGDGPRAREAAAVWAHVRVLAEALERGLPGAPA